MSSKLSTLFWFLSRPQLYPQIWQMFRRRVILRNDTYKIEETQRWCRERAVSELEGVKQLLGAAADHLEPVATLHPAALQAAEERALQSKVEMGGAGALDFLYHITKHYRPQGIIETGVAYGWSSFVFLLASEDWGGQLRSIDMPYPNMGNEAFVGIAVPETYYDRWQLIRLADRQGIPKAIKSLPQVDLVHYDSDKSYSGRWWAQPRLWEVLQPGGLFISDDIQDNIAFIEFAEQMQLEPIVVESQGKYVGILQKPA